MFTPTNPNPVVTTPTPTTPVVPNTTPVVKPPRKPRKPKTPPVQVSRIVTAVLPLITAKVVFTLAGKVIHTSPVYNTRNTGAKLIAYARTPRGGKPSGLSLAGTTPTVVNLSGGKYVKTPPARTLLKG